MAGDLLLALPPERRPGPRTLLAGLVAFADQRGGPVIFHPPHDSTPSERVAWMDRIGIDHCLVNPGGYWQFLEFLGADRPEGAAGATTTWPTSSPTTATACTRVAVVDFSDLAGCGCRSSSEARALGIGPSSSTPCTVGRRGWSRRGIRPGTSCGRPRCDLGMVAVIHVGNTAADFAGWADIGWGPTRWSRPRRSAPPGQHPADPRGADPP